MKHFYNNGKEYLRSGNPRQYRSRQGKSDERYSRDMKLLAISYLGIILTILLIIIFNQ